MKQNKVWKVKSLDITLSDEELIELIKQGKINKDASVSSKDMKIWVRLKDSIYQYYFKEDENETI